MLNRRDLLKRASLLALAPTIPGFLARTAWAVAPERDRQVLVVIQLDGGNDGLNTVVPFADPEYAKLRPTLKQAPQRLLKINDQVGLHPSLSGFGKLLEQGQLAAVAGAGYPNPSRSHFRSMAVWHSARLDPEDHGGQGWLGRALDGGPAPGGAPGALLIGDDQPPVALRGRRSVASALNRLEDYALNPLFSPAATGPQPAGDDLADFVRRSTLDAYRTATSLTGASSKSGDANYPSSTLAQRLRLIAQLLKADLGTRVYYTLQGGYDTHASQMFTHANLLQDLGGAVQAFFNDLTAAKLAERVALLVFSEFGRTVKENASGGTDHGTAAPVFLAGPRVNAGLHGTLPSLTDLEAGEPKMTTDFRQVYATVLDDWLGLPSEASTGGRFERMPLFRGQ